MSTTFIGVDLAWQSDSKDSGIAVLRGDSTGATVVSCSTVKKLFGVVECILSNATVNTVVAIDAPLIIKNKRGQRPCENLIGKKFGQYEASAHSSNLTLYPDARSVQVAKMLEENSFLHAPDPVNDKHKGGRWFFEVYPHPAQVVLFHLEKIIKYKKGHTANKCAGLEILRQYIKTKFVQGKPSIYPNEPFRNVLTRDLNGLKGKELKHYEDTLDALVCAYLALFYWSWGGEKNELLGNLETGYIINPTEAL